MSKLKTYHESGLLEVGVDEAGRGCMLGRVYAGAVFWPPGLVSDLIADSKKLSRKKREEAYEFIITNALGYGIGYAEATEIDKDNILRCSIRAMKRAIDQTNLLPDSILVDGTQFTFYQDYTEEPVSHSCIIEGDSKFYSIAAASILAKVSHDRYIDKLCEEYPELEKYHIQSNMGYGSANHIQAIKDYGISRFHRKSFGICKDYKVI
jgi:ribonuclease HII